MTYIRFRRKRLPAWSLFFLVFLALGISSCTQGGDKGTVGTASRADWVLQIWSSQVCAEPGDTLTVRATVTNTSAKKQNTIPLQNQPVLDIVITNRAKIVHWSDGKTLTPDLTYLELGPHESKTIEMTWQVEMGETIVMEADFIDNPVDSRGPLRGITQVYVGGTCVSGLGY